MPSPVTWQLFGKLVGEVGPYVTPTTKGKAPAPIQKKIDSYQRENGVWTYADHEILSMIAAADLMWEKKIRPVSGKDENALVLFLGVNLASPVATADSQRKTEELMDLLTQQKDLLSTFPTLAATIVGKHAALGPANFSVASINHHGREKLKKACDRNVKAIEKILTRLENVRSMNWRP